MRKLINTVKLLACEPSEAIIEYSGDRVMI